MARTAVAGLGGLEQLGQPFGGVAAVGARPPAGERLQPGERLEAAPRPEIAVEVLRTHAHHRDLAGHEVVAAVQRAVDQDAGADAGADEDERARVVTAGRAPPVLAEHGEVDVVLDDHRGPQRVLEDLAHRDLVPPFQVRRARDAAAAAVDGAGRAGRHREQPLGGRLGLAQ